MPKLNVALKKAVKPKALADITEVEITRIVVRPDRNTIRMMATAGSTELSIVVNGDAYDAIIANVNVANVVALLQKKIETKVAENV